MQCHREARLWNDVFVWAQDVLGVPRGSIRATVLIETILAAFEMDEILYELREHAAGLNAGRWDYIFSVIKTSAPARARLPDRAQVTMAVPFMRAYTAAAREDVPSPRRPRDRRHGGVHPQPPRARGHEQALAKVREDKEREAGDGFDGTWVAHPDLVPVAHGDLRPGARRPPEPEDASATTSSVDAPQLLDFAVPGGQITDAGLRQRVSVGVRYIDSWLHGVGAAAIDNLMEDAATAEISRSQVWQWVKAGSSTREVRRRASRGADMQQPPTSSSRSR